MGHYTTPAMFITLFTPLALFTTAIVANVTTTRASSGCSMMLYKTTMVRTLDGICVGWDGSPELRCCC